MTDQPGLARFQVLLESALLAYEKRAGVILADLGDPLAARLQTCHSVDDITALLQGQAQAIDDLQQRDRIFKSIRTTVSNFTPSLSVAYIADDAGLVSQKTLTGTLTSLTISTDITPTWEGNTRYSWHPTGCMCHSRDYLYIPF